MLRRQILTLLILILAVVYGTSQQLGIELLGGKDKVDIPFDYHQGFIVVDLKFKNAITLSFLFDTGSEHTILFKREIAELLGIPFGRRVKIQGADLTDTLYAHVLRDVNIKVEKTEAVQKDILVMDKDFLQMDEITGERIDGILGSSFFRGLVVKLDYKKKKLTIINPRKLVIPDIQEYAKIPLEIENYKPYIKTNILTEDGDEKRLQILLDTGAALGFLLHANTDTSLVIPDKIVPGSLGKGLGGEIIGYIGKTKRLSFDQFWFDGLLTYYQNLDQSIMQSSTIKRNGLIGNTMLSRFDMYLDMVHSFVYLRPHKNYNKKFRYDKSGLVIYAFGPNLDRYFVKAVIYDTPADRAGIKPGDIIEKVGFRRMKNYSLAKLSKKLSGDDGDKIKLTLRRGDDRYKVTFRLEDKLENIQ